MRLILASTSPYRRALLDRLGVPYEAVAPRCDEERVKARGGAPAAIAAELARAKAESVARRCPDAHVLGGDQLVDLDGEILGKPGTAAAAEAQLRRLAGRTHRLLTAVTLRSPDGEHRELLDEHRMTLRPLTDAEIRRYVARAAPLDCCGSYKIEGLGIALFEAIEGRDFTAIMGLPLVGVAALLRHEGWAIP